MKIGIFDPYLDSLSGGEKYMLTMAACLSSRHEVYIFWDDSSIKLKAKEKLGIELTKVKFTRNIFAQNIYFLSRFLATINYDYIIVLSDGSIPLIASKLIVHFQFPVEWVNVSFKTKIKFLRIAKIICNSQFTKSFIDRRFGVNSTIVYPPVPLPKISKAKKENIILHVGRFGKTHEGKNFKKQDVMIEMFKKMVNGGLKDWQFTLVVGVRKEDEEEFDKLKEQVKGFPIELVKNPENKHLWQFYNKAKIYWHASGFEEDLQKHPERAEHFGISTVEAMGAGAVPVVIEAGGQREIVDDGENGFLWKTIEECMEKTERLVSDSRLWENLSKQAAKKAAIFGKTRFCEKIGELIR